LGERYVLHPAVLPLFDIRVTVGAETPTGGNQESLDVTAMGIVATGALTRGHGCVDLGFVQFGLQPGMAGLAQGTWTVSQKRRESSYMRIVASRAFACLDGSVLHPGSQPFEIMTVQADLELADLVIGRQLPQHGSNWKKHGSGCERNGKKPSESHGCDQGAPPCEAGTSS